jgi:hypothetical protein
VVKLDGHFDMTALLAGLEIDFSSLPDIAAGPADDFLIFPFLFLDNKGGISSVNPAASVPVALPVAYGFKGVDKDGKKGLTERLIGKDSGLSISFGDAPLQLYLDLNPRLIVEPLGLGGKVTPDGNSQSAILTQNYSGSAGRVKVLAPTGPSWEGFLWMIDQIGIERIFTYNVATKKLEPNEVGFTAKIVKNVPVSYGLGGWNFSIDEDADGKGENIGGFAWKLNHIKVAVLKTNLIRSEMQGGVTLPFLGGSPLPGTINGVVVTMDPAATVSRAYGPDGTFTSGAVEYHPEKTGENQPTYGVFAMPGTFNLSRIGGPGLVIECSTISISPELQTLEQSDCASGFEALKGRQITVGGQKMNVTNIVLKREEHTGESIDTGSFTVSGEVLLGDTGQATITAPNSTFALWANAAEYNLRLKTGDSGEVTVFGPKGQQVRLMNIKGGIYDLTGKGAVAFGAGEGSLFNQELKVGPIMMNVAGTTVATTAVFGRKNDQSYWYLSGKASFSGCSITFFGVINVCGGVGGLAYNRAWGQDGEALTYGDLAGQSNKDGLEEPHEASGLQLALGINGNVVDSSTLNYRALVSLNFEEFQLNVVGDAYILKEPKGQPQARVVIYLGAAGAGMNFCVGPVGDLYVPEASITIPCGDLERLELLKLTDGYLLSLQGSGGVIISSSKKLVWIGKPTSKVAATVNFPPLSFDVTGFVMAGNLTSDDLDGMQMSKEVKDDIISGVGVAAGLYLNYDYSAGDSVSVDLGPVHICTIGYNVSAHLAAGVEGIYKPIALQVAGSFSVEAKIDISGSICGIEPELGVGATFAGSFFLEPSNGYASQVKVTAEWPNSVKNISIGLTVDKIPLY